MAILQPEYYYPCLGYPERDAIRIIYDSFIPLYFVVPCAPVDAYYATCPADFEGREEAFIRMFKCTREEVEIVEGFPPVECFVGFWDYYVTWLLYDPIANDTTPPSCFLKDYSEV